MAEYIDAMPPINFDVDPSSHSHMIDVYIMQGLEYYFPPQQRATKQFYITLATMQLIRRKTYLVHIRGCVCRKIKLAVSIYVVRFWASVAVRGRRRPQWCSVRGPVAKSLCLSQEILALDIRRLQFEVKKQKTIDFETLCLAHAMDM